MLPLMPALPMIIMAAAASCMSPPYACIAGAAYFIDSPNASMLRFDRVNAYAYTSVICPT